MEKEVFKALSGSLGLAGKIVGRGVDEVSRVLTKPEEYHVDVAPTGLHFRPCPWSDVFKPRLDFLEPQTPSRLSVNVLKNLTMSSGEREFLHGLNSLFHGDNADALSKFREATRRPESKIQLTDAYYVLGALQCQIGELSEASRSFKTALLAQQGLGKQIRKWAPSLAFTLPLTPSSSFVLGPDLLGLTLLMAYAQSETSLEEAVHTLEQLLELMENEPTALFFINLFRSRKGEPQAVFQSLQRTLPDSNLQVASMILLGKACASLGDALTAREIFRKAAQHSPLDHSLRLDLRMGLAQTLRLDGHVREAEREEREIYELDRGYRSWEDRLGLSGASSLPAEESSASVPVAAAPPIPTAPSSIPAAAPTPAAQSAVSPAPTPAARIPAEPVNLIDSHGGVSKLYCEARQLEHTLSGRALVIGREEGDIVLEGDAAASRAHARITFEEGTYFIEDLNSTNGTWVNRHRIRRRVELHRGDTFSVGESTFEVR